MSFNHYQRIAARSYKGGQFNHILIDEKYWEFHLYELGSLVFSTIIKELSHLEGCVSTEDAIARMQRIIIDIEDVQTALMNEPKDEVYA